MWHPCLLTNSLLFTCFRWFFIPFWCYSKLDLINDCQVCNFSYPDEEKVIVELFRSVAGCLKVKEFLFSAFSSWEPYKEELKRILSLNYSLMKISCLWHGSGLPDDFGIADRNYYLYKHSRFKTVKPVSPSHSPRKISKLDSSIKC